MKQKQKELLLKDICARSLYKTKIKIGQNIYIISGVVEGVNDEGDWTYYVHARGISPIEIEFCKPCLFPLSSMTEEQYDELEKMTLNDYMDHMCITNELREKVEFITHWPLYSPDIIDWFNRNHFDYKGLIDMGLAEDVTGLNIY